MKINSTLVTELAVVFFVIMIAFVALSQIQFAGENLGTGEDAITLLECFESPDVNETNPDGLSAASVAIYSYAETDWILANVTDLYGAPVSDQCYWVNDSDGDGCYSTFTFASDTYTSASFYFMMNDAYHVMTNVSLEAADGSDLLRFNISDTEVSCHNDTTELWDEDITSGVWYRISVALNWEGTFTTALHSVSIAGILTPVGTGSGAMGAGAVSYGSCAIFNVSGDVGSDTVLYIDNLYLYKAETGTNSYIGDTLIEFAIVVSILVIAIVVSILFLVVREMQKRKK